MCTASRNLLLALSLVVFGLSADAQNVFSNSDFNTHVQGWGGIIPPPRWDPDDSRGFPWSGSFFGSSDGDSLLSISNGCDPVTPGGTYQLSFWFKYRDRGPLFPDSNPLGESPRGDPLGGAALGTELLSAGGQLHLEFGGASCFDHISSEFLFFPLRSAWERQRIRVQAPAGASFVHVVSELNHGQTEPWRWDVYFDGIYLLPLLFDDGFETGNLNAWTEVFSGP